jgi:flagellar motor protein MotB
VRVIQGHRQIFLVKGHTSQDDFPESATAEQKMNLSVRRAQHVADYLTSHGVEPEIIRVQGCSTFEPVVLRAYTDDARTLNRRVEVEGTDSPVTDRQDAVKTTRVPSPDLRDATVSTPTETIVH